MKQTIEIEVPDGKKAIWKDGKVVFEDIKHSLCKLNKKNKFNPKTLKPFDKVLVRDSYNYVWKCDLFSHIEGIISDYRYRCIASCYRYCIPYNEDTKHLLNTCNLPSEYYIYWEGYPKME